MSEPDFVTVNQGVSPHRFNVVVMHFDEREGEYVVRLISQPMTKVSAQSLAKAWAAIFCVEVR